MRAAIYARVSTADQSTGMQLRELEEFCQRRSWTIASTYIDTGVSGSKESRPELDRLWADAKRRRFDAVAVYRYDRFARSLRQLVNALEEFRALAIDFVSLHEGVDTSTPNGRLIFGIFASIAEFERELIRERVRSALAHAKAKGRKLGRPARITPGLAQQASELKSQGKSWGQIEAILKTPRSTVRRAAALCQKPGAE